MFAGLDTFFASDTNIGVDHFSMLVNTKYVNLTKDVLLASFHALEARLALVWVEVNKLRSLRLTRIEME